MKKNELAAAICALCFVAVLGVSAVFDRSIRMLHTFESIPYLAAAILSLRHNKFGYALGTVSGAFWILMAGFRTTFIRNGFQLLFAGKFDRPDILIAVPAAIAAGGLAIFSAVAYARSANKSWRDAGAFAAALFAVPIFFLLIFAEFAPRYLPLFGLT
ncbi:MAG TPA: hypothetical protein VER58_09740 [Thermoanaerobaculia bacterium]|nr:hypothetical protein [Thermoanaerobaculia bacterium]